MGVLALFADVLKTSGRSAFSGIVWFQPAPLAGKGATGAAAPRRSDLVALRAEPEGSPEEEEDDVIDVEDQSGNAEEADKDEEEQLLSVFDGPKSPLDTETHIFKKAFGKHYWYFRHNCSYRFQFPNGTIEEGKWNRDFGVPEKEFQAHKNYWWSRYWKKLGRLKAKYRGQIIAKGSGQRYYVLKMLRHPFTKLVFGERYEKRAKWKNSPIEVERAEQAGRAAKLGRRLRLEAEQVRLDRLKELGVFPGFAIDRRQRFHRTKRPWGQPRRSKAYFERTRRMKKPPYESTVLDPELKKMYAKALTGGRFNAEDQDDE